MGERRMRFERGFSVGQLFLWLVVLIIVAGTGMKVIPSWIEYSKTLKAVQSAAQNAGPNSTVPDIRRAYEKQADVDHLKVVKPTDLEITKDGGQIVINFAFNEKVPLFGPASLLIEYQGSSRGKSKGE